MYIMYVKFVNYVNCIICFMFLQLPKITFVDKCSNTYSANYNARSKSNFLETISDKDSHIQPYSCIRGVSDNFSGGARHQAFLVVTKKWSARGTVPVINAEHVKPNHHGCSCNVRRGKGSAAQPVLFAFTICQIHACNHHVHEMAIAFAHSGFMAGFRIGKTT